MVCCIAVSPLPARGLATALGLAAILGIARAQSAADLHNAEEIRKYNAQVKAHWEATHTKNTPYDGRNDLPMPPSASGGGSRASTSSDFPIGQIPGATAKQQLIATGATGLLGMLLNSGRPDEPDPDGAERQEAARQARERAAQQAAQAEQERLQREAALERARREVEAAKLRAELQRVRDSARDISDGIALIQQSAAEGKADSYPASVFNYAPTVKISIDTLMDVVSELGGGALKTVAYGYKAVQDGFDIFGQGQRVSVGVPGAVTETGSMVVNAGKAADAIAKEYKGELSGMGTLVKAAKGGVTAAEFATGEGDWLKAMDTGKDIAGEFLPKLGKGIVAGATGAVKVGVELGAAGQRGEELSQLRGQLDRTAQNAQAKYGAKVDELNSRANSLEQQLRDLESERISPAPVPPAGGTGRPMVLPDLPITVPSKAPPASVVLPPKG